ncbi:TRZ/ATZ family hydrolase [Saccharospirillum mangrovi]|uniref:TRZ/ATZ family hydrolase n=1 Tax=Saccharospirillum mangrovi TaxID=2161747 RepID=UPI000D39AF9B|nr:TRZ/ATZ family hydrolase [Saccharospirillum mangrovi]
MQRIDTLIHAHWIIPVNPQRDVLVDHSLAIKDGIIEAILPTDQAKAQYQADDTVELGESALIPGFINTHGHAAMALFRGMGDDLELMTWLNDHIWPAEGAWVGDEFVADGTELAIAEMLRSGTTTFADNYFFPAAAAEVTERAGVRAQFSFSVIDFPTNWAKTADEHIDLGMELVKRYKGHSHIKMMFGPHAPYTVSDEPMIRIRDLAKEHDLMIQMHVHETQTEVDGEIEKRGGRPIRRLKDLGLLGPQFQAVHMTALNEEDIQDIAQTGTHVVHCPESNLKLASGFCPVDQLQKLGVNVALGTDGAASNNDLDMMGEMRTAAILAKAVGQRATALPAMEALAMATLNGARAMGWEQEIGSLEVGKRADITAVRLDDLESQPLYDPVSHLVYASTRDQVSDVWVDGKRLLKQRQLTTLDRDAIIAKAKQWQARITNTQ